MKLVMLLKLCLNYNYSNVRISIHLSDAFCIKNGLKHGDATSPLLVNFSLQYTGKLKKKVTLSRVHNEVTSECAHNRATYNC
jgi:hypothetical protein